MSNLDDVERKIIQDACSILYARNAPVAITEADWCPVVYEQIEGFLDYINPWIADPDKRSTDEYCRMAALEDEIKMAIMRCDADGAFDARLILRGLNSNSETVENILIIKDESSKLVSIVISGQTPIIPENMDN